MSAIDTSPERLRWLSRKIEAFFGGESTVADQAAATLDSLAKEKERAADGQPEVVEKHDAPAPDGLREAVVETIGSISERAMRNHQLSNMVDADHGGPYPLVDALAAPGSTVEDGEEQIREIVDCFVLEASDAILALFAPHLAAAEARGREDVEAVIAKMEADHTAFLHAVTPHTRSDLMFEAIAGRDVLRKVLAAIRSRKEAGRS